MTMEITYDKAKNSKNIDDRGLSFDLVAHIDFGTSVIREDIRKNYGEKRFIIFGYIGDRLHVAVITPRKSTVHVIRLRKANDREVKEYGIK